MFRIIGMILLVIGTTGVAWVYCREQKERLETLKSIKQIYEFLQNEMVYARASLPEICNRLSSHMSQPFSKVFQEIYNEINDNNGASFEEIWEKHMNLCMKTVSLKKNEREILTAFPKSLGFRDGKGQAEGIERYIRETSYYIKGLEEELKNKNKVIMCMGVMSGIMTVILLL